jgi:hypothetical protein
MFLEQLATVPMLRRNNQFLPEEINRINLINQKMHTVIIFTHETKKLRRLMKKMTISYLSSLPPMMNSLILIQISTLIE